MSTQPNEATAADALDLYTQQMRIVSRRTASEQDALEAAAAISVLREVLAAEVESRHETHDAGDAWGRSARGVRRPLSPGPGQWRSFSG